MYIALRHLAQRVETPIVKAKWPQQMVDRILVNVQHRLRCWYKLEELVDHRTNASAMCLIQQRAHHEHPPRIVEVLLDKLLDAVQRADHMPYLTE